MAEKRTTEDEWRAIASHGRRPEWIARFAAPRPEIDEDEVRYWRQASDELKGRTLAGLLRLVDAGGPIRPKTDMFPGWRNIRPVEPE